MTQEQIADLAKLDTKAMLALIIEQRKALEEASKPKALSFKVTQEKTDANGVKSGTNGALSIYGLGRFPVTLYAQSWERIFAEQDKIKAFIKSHPELSRK